MAASEAVGIISLLLPSDGSNCYRGLGCRVSYEMANRLSRGNRVGLILYSDSGGEWFVRCSVADPDGSAFFLGSGSEFQICQIPDPEFETRIRIPEIRYCE